jgi:hypothetical protein
MYRRRQMGLPPVEDPSWTPKIVATVLEWVLTALSDIPIDTAGSRAKVAGAPVSN